jgi:alpha-L-rhamnosidase
VAGLAPAAPGYRRILVRPEPTHELTSASARHRTPYGDAAVAWQRADGMLALEVVVPVGVTAIVHVPGRAEPVEVRHGTHTWRVPDVWGTNGALPPAATVRDVLDHEPSWQQVVEAAEDLAIVKGEAQAAGRLEAYLDAPAISLVDALAPRGMARGGEALRERLTPALRP